MFRLKPATVRPVAQASLSSSSSSNPPRPGSPAGGGSRARPVPRRRPVRHDPWSDIPALLLLGAGTLLFLALISYQPADVPAWVPFSFTATPNPLAQNFIGRVGAILGGLFFFTFGAGSFLVAATLLFLGVGKMLVPRMRILPRALWAAGLTVSGACLAELPPWAGLLGDWRTRYNLPRGAGGWLGSGLDVGLFQPLLGSIGAPIVLHVIYACCLILMTGLHPLTQLRHGLDSARRVWTNWRQRREAYALAHANERDLLQREEQRLARERAALEKQLRRRGGLPVASEPAGLGAPDEGNPGADDEFAHLPPPKITDNSAPPPPAAPKKKPLLSDHLAARQGARPPTAGFGAEPGGDIRFADYQLPDTDLLDTRDAQDHQAANEKELHTVQTKIIETLDQFGIKVSPGDITKGPTITRYEVYPAKGVRVDKIVSLEKDLARATRAERINILAPIPGKDTVGIEIANSRKVKVTLRELLESQEWEETKAKIPLALGKDVYGKTIIADLAAMPHCLVAGATGSGKSVCINSIVASLLYKFTPEQLRLVMVDPKVVELQVYNELPHLVVPVVTDPKKVLLALRWVIDEMMKRYELFARTGVRNVTGFNARPKPKTQAELDAENPAASDHPKSQIQNPKSAWVDPVPAATPDEAVRNAPALNPESEPGAVKLQVSFGQPEDEPEAEPPDEEMPAPRRPAARNEREAERIPDHLPYIVVIVDELADLMQTAPADVESAIARITQMARAAGIHMIIATQTPRADVITGVIKANVPSRVAFNTSSALDSRVILDENGAERLLGQGDMLCRMPPNTARLTRAQGVFVADEEVHRLVQHAAAQGAPTFESAIHEQLQNAGKDEGDVTDEDEELVDKCLEIMRQEKKASTSMLQRRLRLGYTRAARIVDIMEARGILGPENGARGREILVDLDEPL